MRDYAKVAPQFWTGRTGKALKDAGHEAVIVGLYLMTSPHANMIGVYHCPLAYIAFDTGLGMEGASKGLQSAIEAGFCTFEADTNYIFVHEFAAYQIGEDIDPKDNRVKGIKNELDKVPKGQCWQSFRARYAVPFHLPPNAAKASPLQAPCKPETGAGEETGAEAGAGVGAAAPPAADAPATKGSRLSTSWALPKAWGEWALAEFPSWTPEAVRNEANKFRDFWVGKSGKDATKVDWEATWRNWCRNAKSPGPLRQNSVQSVAAEAARQMGFTSTQPDVIDA